MTIMPLTYCLYDSPGGVEQLKQGHEQAWKELVRCYSGRLRYDIFVSLVKRSLPDWSLQDIEQESYIIASDKIKKGEFIWRRQGSLYNWLRAISLNRILSRIPRYIVMAENLSFEEIDLLEHENGYWLDRFLQDNGLLQNGPEAEIVSREEKAEMWQILLGGENPIHVEITIQRWVEGKKPRELAEIYGLKASTISQILWLMKKQLEVLLGTLNANTQL
jgi:DNA-directed RNA polymerase specialized sigma24 family protein